MARFVDHKCLHGAHPDGVGRLFTRDGWLIYKGDFKVSSSGLMVPHGRGIYFYPGTVDHRYEGVVRDGLPSGEGVCFKPDGSVEYLGQWWLGSPAGNSPGNQTTLCPPPVSILHGSVPCSKCDRNYFEHRIGLGCGHKFKLDIERVRWDEPDGPSESDEPNEPDEPDEPDELDEPDNGMNRRMQLVLSSNLLA